MNKSSRRAVTRRQFVQTSAAASLAVGATVVAPLQAVAGMAMSEQAQLNLTAVQALNAIRNKQLSAQTYVQTLLNRAEQLAGLNLIIALDKQGALEAAARIDTLVKQGKKLPPLAGLPLVVKDNINTSNLPTTGGTPALKNAQPKQHAPSVQALVDAGAIVLGKTNLHELAFGITSTNFSPFAGFAKNPYDTTRMPGGSSGGTAASVAARISPVGLGTDTGGSVRLPSALCGVVGLRPSVGNGGQERRYHNDGAVVPISHTRDTVGPIGRTVADVALLDAVMTGSKPAQPVALKGLRFGVPASFWSGLDNSVSAVMAQVKTKLTQAGATLVDVDLDGLMDLNNKVSFMVALHEPVADIPAYLAANHYDITLAQVANQVASPDVKGAFGAIMGDVFAGAYPDAMNVHRPKMQALYAQYLKEHHLDAILFPTSILPAAPIDEKNGSSKVSINGGEPADEFGTFIRNTDPGSNAGIPGLSLFAGMTAAGLPVGVEIDGALGSDTRLLGIGMSMERVLGVAPAPQL